jgi:hypothetical protein
MKCNLCGQEIKGYDPAFHHLEIDDSHAVDICQGCIDRIFKWQGSIYSRLFPTSALKKKYGKDRKDI